MTNQQPTIGCIVHYELNDGDVDLIKSKHGDKYDKTLNQPRAGQAYAAMVVAAWNTTAPDEWAVNLQVFLDGDVTYWATSREERSDDESAGRWFWPPRV